MNVAKTNPRRVFVMGSGSQSNWLNLKQIDIGGIRRKNASLLVEMDKGNAAIDMGDAWPDNWHNLLRTSQQISFPKAILITHSHQDHITFFGNGLEYYAKRENTLPLQIFAGEKTWEGIRSSFPYLNDNNYEFHPIRNGEIFNCLGKEVLPFKLTHGLECFGFRFGGLAYISDFDGKIQEEIMESLIGTRTIIMECNFLDEPKEEGHNHFEKALSLGRKFHKMWGINKLILTHLGDEFPEDHKECLQLFSVKSGKLGFEVIPAYDLMTFEIPDW